MFIFFLQITKFEKLETDEERIKTGKDIYDQFIMKELLSQSHVSMCFVWFIHRTETTAEDERHKEQRPNDLPLAGSRGAWAVVALHKDWLALGGGRSLLGEWFKCCFFCSAIKKNPDQSELWH